MWKRAILCLSMRSLIACVALTGCLSTTSKVTIQAVPAPVTVEVEGDCEEARRTHPNVLHCESESDVTGAGVALVVVSVLILVLALAVPHGSA